MVTILFSCLALLIFVLSMDLSWSNLVSVKRNDLIFEGRNQEYGAYVLRREHHVNVFYSLLCSILFFVGLLVTIYHYSKPTIQVIERMTGIIIELPLVPKIDDSNKPKDSKKIDQKIAATAAGASNTEYQIVDDQDTQTAKADTDLRAKQFGDGNDTGEIQNPLETGCLDCDGAGKDSQQDTIQTNNVETWVPEMPQFPGGPTALQEYLMERVKYTPREQELGAEGTILVSFTVSAVGNVYNVDIERSILHGERLSQKTADAVRTMPQWTPGKRGDKTVPVRIVIPLKFELKK